jgi:cytochrome c-type biogenesis protein CcmF
MIAELGLAFLWLAFAMALAQTALGIFTLVQPVDVEAHRAIKPVAVAQGLLATLSFACLIAVFLLSDMSVKLVVANSHSAKPWLFKLAGSWGNHEGSMLLWVMVLAVGGAGVALFEKRLRAKMLSATLMAQAVIALGFYAFILFASNPFTRVNPAPAEGAGLNPLLQDPGLAFHPPTLYLGYVGLSIAFSFAVGALLTNDVGPAFARAMRPWVLGAWVFLTLGITAGSYWAYYELGWGGWWFWDPVENASLMPWIAATALLHSVSVLATRGALRAWTVMLAVVAFSMSMLGTFLVRSGILTSVHAFAVDPTRGSFILVLLGLYIGGALTLYALRVSAVKEGTQFDLFSREGALVLNNLLLSMILGVVLIGTLYPIFAQSFGQQVSIGAPYFDLVTGSITLLLCLALMFGPLMRWRRQADFSALKPASPALIIGLGVTTWVSFASPKTGWLPVLGLGVAAATAVASLAPIMNRKWRRVPLFTWGMVFAHLGVAVALAGMAGDSAFMKERLIALPAGGSTTVGPFSIRLRTVEPVLGPNWSALEGVLEARRGDGAPFTLRSQQRAYTDPYTETSEAAISTRMDGQLYAVLGKSDAQGRWQLRLWWKPMVTLIWLGGIIIALGGLLALIGRVARDWGRHAGGRHVSRRYAGERLAEGGVS